MFKRKCPNKLPYPNVDRKILNHCNLLFKILDKMKKIDNYPYQDYHYEEDVMWNYLDGNVLYFKVSREKLGEYKCIFFKRKKKKFTDIFNIRDKILNYDYDDYFTINIIKGGNNVYFKSKCFLKDIVCFYYSLQTWSSVINEGDKILKPELWSVNEELKHIVVLNDPYIKGTVFPPRLLGKINYKERHHNHKPHHYNNDKNLYRYPTKREY